MEHKTIVLDLSATNITKNTEAEVTYLKLIAIATEISPCRIQTFKNRDSIKDPK